MQGDRDVGALPDVLLVGSTTPADLSPLADPARGTDLARALGLLEASGATSAFDSREMLPDLGCRNAERTG